MLNIIFNPTARRGDSQIALIQTTRYLDSQNIEYRIYETAYPWHAKELASQIAATSDRIVVIGGDGTIFEVINGGGADVAYAIIPAGTGNDIARMLGIPCVVEEAVKIAVNGGIRSIDYGLVNGEHKSVLFTSFGIVAGVIDGVRKMTKASKFAYYKTLLRNAWGHKPQRYEVDGKECFSDFITLQNARQSGGGMVLSESAEIDDGAINVVIIEYRNKFRRMLNLVAMFRGRLSRQPNVRTYLTQGISVVPMEGAELCCFDGELIEVSRVDMVVYPKGVKFVSPV